jgi:hypothetical protein
MGAAVAFRTGALYFRRGRKIDAVRAVTITGAAFRFLNE